MPFNFIPGHFRIVLCKDVWTQKHSLQPRPGVRDSGLEGAAWAGGPPLVLDRLCGGRPCPSFGSPLHPPICLQQVPALQVREAETLQAH